MNMFPVPVVIVGRTHRELPLLKDACPIKRMTILTQIIGAAEVMTLQYVNLNIIHHINMAEKLDEIITKTLDRYGFDGADLANRHYVAAAAQYVQGCNISLTHFQELVAMIINTVGEPINPLIEVFGELIHVELQEDPKGGH